MSLVPVFDERDAIERQCHDLELIVDGLIASFNETPVYVEQNFVELSATATKLNFLLSAMKLPQAAE